MDIQPSRRNSLLRECATVTFDSPWERQVLDMELPRMGSMEGFGHLWRILSFYQDPEYPLSVDVPYRALGAAFASFASEPYYRTPDTPPLSQITDEEVVARHEVVRALAEHFSQLSGVVLEKY